MDTIDPHAWSKDLLMFGAEAGPIKERLKIPYTEHLRETHPGMEFRNTPELHLQIFGETEIIGPDFCLPMQEKSMALLPRGTPYYCRGQSAPGTKPAQKRVCAFGRSEIWFLCQTYDQKHREHTSSIQAYASADSLSAIGYLDDSCDAALNLSCYGKERQEGLLRAVFSILQECLAHALVHEETSAKYSKVALCKNLIHDQLTHPELSLSFLANAAGYSKEYLARCFKEETGMSIGTYIRWERIQLATKLLHQPNLNISEIAYRCGFQNLNYFSRSFKQLLEMSPTRYRALHHAGDSLEASNDR